MHAHKLTPTQICKIPALLNSGENISSIGRILGVTPAAIRGVILEEKWKRYEDEPPGQEDRCPDCGAKVKDDTQPCLECTISRRRGKDRENRLKMTEKLPLTSPAQFL